MSKILKRFITKSLSVSYFGENWINNLTQNIIEAGRTISYVETLCNKADTLHLKIKQIDKKLIMRVFEDNVRIAIKKLNIKKVKIAFDVTEDLTWIKEKVHLRPSSKEKHLPAWQYLNLSIVEPFFFPLMSVHYSLFNSLDNLVIDLLNYVKSLRLEIDLILFDRGFYKGSLINYLNRNNFPYLMLVPKRGKIKRFAEETKSLNSFIHEIKYNKNGSGHSSETRIIARRIDEKVCWCYATNKKSSLDLVLEYKKRWNIETGFRVHDEARIKSKSKHDLIRYFYHLIGMLLIIIWRIQNKINYSTFKRFLKILEYQFYSDEIKKLLAPP